MPELSSLEYLGNAEYRVAGTEIILSPLNRLIDLSEDAAKADRVQMLFGEG